MPIFRKKNENFFKVWSPEVAYILGFFAADGNMVRGKRGNHYIAFYSCDLVIIQVIRNAIGSNHKIAFRIEKDRNRAKKCYQIQIGSQTMFNDLLAIGFTPNKSLTIRFPHVPDSYLKDFIRGYFDGDGHVSTGFYARKDGRKKKHLLMTGFTSGSREFLAMLHKKLMQNGVVSGGSLYYLKGFRLNFAASDSLGLYNFLYSNVENSLYLPRKKKVFEKYLRLKKRA